MGKQSLVQAFLVTLLILLSFSSRASHIVGGEVTYQCLGSNYYRITLTLYRDDCDPNAVVMPATADIVIDEIGGASVGTFTLNKNSYPNIYPKPGCGLPTPNFCLEKATFVLDSVNLPPSPTGYVAYHYQCCRSNSVTNIMNAWKEGITVPAYIYNNSGCYSSPYFANYPPIIVPRNVPLAIPAGAQDSVGDSLYHELCSPLNSTSTSPPFNSVPFASPYTGTYPVPSSPPLSIDPSTGVITGSITGLGNFSVGICVYQYKNGVLIGRVRRDYQFIVVNAWRVFASITSKTDAGCGTSTGSATVQAGGGSGPYSYKWSNSKTTPSISGLSAGTYSVVVTDNGGCTDTARVTIKGGGGFTASVSSVSNIPCGGGAGSATISVSGGSSTPTITWPDATTGPTHNALAAGTYKVAVSMGGCTDTLPVTISQIPGPSLAVQSKTDESCPGSADGSVDIQISGGISPYSYQWNDGPTTEDRTGLSPGTYYLVVTDATGCRDTISVSIASGTGLTMNWATQREPSCAGAADGLLKPGVSGGTSPYSYKWSTGATGLRLNGIPAGNYWVYAEDQNGCGDTIYITLGEPDSVQISLVKRVDPTCFGATDAEFEVSVSGGSAPYSYALNGSPSASLVQNLGAGNYLLEVTDANGCTAQRNIILSDPDSIRLVVDSMANTSCKGSGDGFIVVTATGGSGSLSYSWSNAVATAANLNLGEGTYTLTVTDSLGCSRTRTFNIASPPALQLTADSIKADACGTSTGYASVQVNGGTAPYSYNWSNGSASASASNLASGTYTVIVTDASGCSDSLSINISNSSGLSAILDSTANPACYGAANGYASISLSNAQAPVSILWSTGDTTLAVAGLASGSHWVVATDANGCKDSLAFTLTQPAALQITADSLVDASCGQSTGYASVQVSGGTVPYSYSWSNGSTSASANNLSSGTYSVIVTDASGCSDSLSVNISNSSGLSASLDSTANPGCYGAANGFASISVSNAQNPVSILWSTGDTTTSTSGLAAGPHWVVATDANGCKDSLAFSLSQPTALQITADSLVDASCGQSTGYASVQVNGGTAPYSYNWSNGSTAASASNLSSGTYSVIVTDASGCSDSLSINISNSSGLSAILDSTANPACYGAANGYASISLSNAQPPVSILWSSGDTTLTATGLAAGPHWVVATDANGCKDSLAFSLSQPTALQITADSLVDASCGQSTGYASVQVNGGTAPYSYNWSNGSASASANNLSSGTYSVIVTDASGCSDSLSINISNSSGLSASLDSTANPACYGAANGFASISVSNAQVPVSILWSTGDTTLTATGLASGSHWVVAKDANGCKDSLAFSLSQPTALQITADSLLDASCGQSTGYASVQVSGGTAPYSYNWSNGSTSASANNLSSGTYTVIVTDASGCSDSLSINISNSSGLSASLDSTANPACNGAANGFASISVSNAQNPVSILWSTGDTTTSTSGLAAGSHWVVATDANGCKDSLAFTLTQPAALQITADSLVDASCGQSTGYASVTVSGGTAPYSYSWSNGSTAASASNLSSGTYSIIVTDASGCSDSLSVNISNSSGLSASLDSTANPVCYGAANGFASISVSNAQAPVSILWSTGDTTLSATNLTAGSHWVVATDANGCKDSLAFSLSQPTVLQITADSLVDASCGQSTGYASVQVSGGTAPYSYNWSNGSAAASASNLSSGTYSVIVTDASGCSDSLSINISNSSGLSASLDSTANPVCYGAANGFASISVSNAQAPVSILWSTGDTTLSATNLTAGPHWVVATDANGCKDSLAFSLSQPAALQITADSLVDASCGQSTGYASVQVSGGTAPYSYNWSNGSAAASASSLSSGTYSVIVTDASGCSDSLSVNISNSSGLSASLDSTANPGCYGAANGFASISVSNAQAPVSILWSTGDTTLSATNLTAGPHWVVATDANGCKDSLAFSLSQPTALQITADSLVDASCGQSTGYASVQVNGGTAPYSYNWSNGSASASANNLSSGTYSVIVTDASGCSDSLSVNISNSSGLSASLDSTANPVCYGAANGFASISVSNAQAPVSILWSTGDTTLSATNLTAGSHWMVATDANGCKDSLAFTLTQPAALQITADSLVDASCGQSTGYASVQVSGGTVPYSYSWSNGYTSASASSLSSGTYSVIVTDASGCSDSLSINISNSSGLSASLDSTANPVCYGAANGFASISVSNAQAPVSILWSTGDTTLAVSGLAAGSHWVVATDANGCKDSLAFTLTQPAALQITADSLVDASCGQATGYASVQVNGGTAPYSYNWSNGSASASVNNLSSGTYSVIVTDASGCSDSLSVNISNSSGLSVSLDSTANPVCYGAANGFASISVSNAQAPVSILWSTGDTTLSASGLAAGQHWVVATDANGCKDSLAFTLTQPAALQITADSLVDASCGQSTGYASVQVSGGTAPYSYNWSNGSASASANNLSSGTYSVIVTDASGCSDSLSINISNSSGLSASLDSTANPGCYGAANGFASISVSNAQNPVSILWSTGHTTTSTSGLAAGQHWVVATDANGCKDSLAFSLSQPTVLQITADSLVDASCGQTTGYASVTVSGGTAPYSYNWSNGSTAASASNLSSGTYSVIVTDASGCSDSLSINISNSSGLSASLDSTANPACYGAANGYASISLSNAQAPVSILWSTGDTTLVVAGLASGSHWVVATDANGCKDSLAFSLSQPTALQITPDSLVDASCGQSTGYASVQVSGGTAPYSYNWSNGSASASANNLSSGTYSVIVTDASGCSDSLSINISNSSGLSASLDSTANPACYGAANGYASISLSNAQPPVSILWSTGDTTLVVAGLASGSQWVVATDANGCKDSLAFSLSQPAALQITADSLVDASCGQSTGYASVTVSGGTAPYTYNWGNGTTNNFISNLSGGNYAVIVTDAKGCSDSLNITVTATPAVQLQLDSLHAPLCFGGRAFAKVSVTGGQGPFTFNWGAGSVSSIDTAWLPTGNHHVFVSDLNGCGDTLSFSVQQPDSLQVKLDSLKKPDCYGEANAFLEVSAVGGTPPYTYTWSNGSHVDRLAYLPSGTYHVQVTDAAGCSASGTYGIGEPDSFVVVIDSIHNPRCYGDADGRVYLRALNGDSITKVVTSHGKVDPGRVSDLPAGSYHVFVQNARGCMVSVQFEITGPERLRFDVLALEHPVCDNNETGMIDFKVRGGVPPYNLQWDDGSQATYRDDLKPGDYHISLTDASGCALDTTISIKGKEVNFDVEVIPMECTDAYDADLRVEVEGAARPYTVKVNEAEVYGGQMYMEAGWYKVSLLDADGCQWEVDIEVQETSSGKVFIPNAFTPNGDGLNEQFELKGDSDCLKDAHLEIFTRWGGKIFETNHPLEEFWDGTVDGQPAKTDVYMYILTSQQKPVQGYFKVVR